VLLVKHRQEMRHYWHIERQWFRFIMTLWLSAPSAVVATSATAHTVLFSCALLRLPSNYLRKLSVGNVIRDVIRDVTHDVRVYNESAVGDHHTNWRRRYHFRSRSRRGGDQRINSTCDVTALDGNCFRFDDDVIGTVAVDVIDCTVGDIDDFSAKST